MATPRTTHSPSRTRGPRCPACGRPTGNDLVDGKCPLCNYQVAAPSRIADDVTPYAQAGASGWRMWGSMCAWVFSAASQRLTHLALTPRSPASTRFVRRSLLVFAVAMTLFSTTQFGWHRAMPEPGADPTAGTSEAAGKGWVRVAVASPPVAAVRGPSTPVALWWNLPQAAIAVPATFVTALLIGWLLLAIIGAGSDRALSTRYRGQGRLRGALRYGSGWVLWLLLAGGISLLLPLCYVKEVTGLWFIPSRISVCVVAAVVAAVGVLMWWFWLIRVAGTVPLDARTRVVLFYAMGTPLITGGLLVCWWVGLVYGLRLLTPVLKLQW